MGHVVPCAVSLLIVFAVSWADVLSDSFRGSCVVVGTDVVWISLSLAMIVYTALLFFIHVPVATLNDALF